MPYKSSQQRKYFHWALEHKKPGFNEKMVHEFDQASKGMKLPHKLKKTRKSLKGEK